MAMLQIDGKDMPDPAALEWSLETISSSSAGRTSSGKMQTCRICQKVVLSPRWNNPDPDTASKLLQAANPEYINVTYFDPKENKMTTREFYAGTKKAPFRSWFAGKKRFTEVAFDLIER